MFHLSRFTVSMITALIGFTAQAFPLPQGSLADLTFTTQAQSNYDFEGIIALSNCSGSLVRLENSKETDAALIFTNGHCLETGFSKPGQVVSHKPSNRRMNVLNSKAQVLGTVTAVEIVYSTMTNTDLTIYRTKETYADILSKYQVRPLTLASQHPVIGTAIDIISGYWKKGYSCSIEAFIPQLKESEWTFTDSIRYSRPGCETIGGTSGSPIIQSASATLIGINNTGNEDGERCSMNNPCEVDSNGQISFEKGVSYGQQTYWVYSCLNEQNDIDLQKSGCQLPH